MSDNGKKEQLDSVWKLVRQSIMDEGRVPIEALNLWFSDISLRELTPESATIAVKSEFKYNILLTRYHDTIEDHISRVVGYEPKLNIIFDRTGYVPRKLDGEGYILSPLEIAKKRAAEKRAAEKKESKSDTSESDTEENTEKDDSPSFLSTNTSGPEKLTFNPDYTFENFVVGSSNSLAYAAAKAVAENPTDMYNPFFIYGPSGVGKTHLMYAITNRVLELHPDMKITYVKGEEFANQLIESISKKYGGISFREKYRTVDMLLIDDVHFIAGRETVQEEFFHTFNALFDDHKQIVVSSDRPPKDMETLEMRIKSRFESGLLADMQSPDLDLRLAIIRRKSDSAGISLTSDSEKLLADSFDTNIRQIEGIIKKLSARFFLTGEKPSIESIRQFLTEFHRETKTMVLNVDRAISSAAAHFGVSADDVRGPKRNKEIKLARNAAMLVMKNNTQLTLEQIGAFFKRNHSTVYSNCAAAEALAEADQSYADIIKEIENESLT